VTINAPPLRYAYDIIGQGDCTIQGTCNNPNQPPAFKAGLLQMTISKFGGWTPQAWTSLNQYFNNSSSGSEGQPPPNPLALVPNSNPPVYVTNASQWNAFLAFPQNIGRARFILCRALGIDTTVYILPTEKCYVNGQVINPDDSCYQFVPSGPLPTDGDLITAVNTGGSVSGLFGVCSTPSYKLQTFMKYGGFLIPIGLFVADIFFILYFNKSSPDSLPISREPVEK